MQGGRIMTSAIVLCLAFAMLARCCHFLAGETRSLAFGTALLLLTVVFLFCALACMVYAVVLYFVGLAASG